MSYQQAMKWHKKHPKGVRNNYMGFACSSSFWPSRGYLEKDYDPYVKACQEAGIKPWTCEKHYRASCRGGIFCFNTLEANVEWTKNHPEIVDNT